MTAQQRKKKHKYPLCHAGIWCGIVGKGPDGEPVIGLEQMLGLIAKIRVGGLKFDGVDILLLADHISSAASEEQLDWLAELLNELGLMVGTVAAAVWPGTDGASAMGSDADRRKYVDAYLKACKFAKGLERREVRRYGCIRGDTGAGNDKGASIEEFLKDPVTHTTNIAKALREAAIVADDYGERIALEEEICWAGMHTWKYAQNMVELVDRSKLIGLQPDMAHAATGMLGLNAPKSHKLINKRCTQADFDSAFQTVGEAWKPWTFDFHVSQNGLGTRGGGGHDVTGEHCTAKDRKGKIKFVQHSKLFIEGLRANGGLHMNWDGCLFPNEVILAEKTWEDILEVMLDIQDAHGWDD